MSENYLKLILAVLRDLTDQKETNLSLATLNRIFSVMHFLNLSLLIKIELGRQ